MSRTEPIVHGTLTKDAGRYKLGMRPQNLASHNRVSLRIIEAILEARCMADCYDLAVAVRRHKHGTKVASSPQSFVWYCIKSGWLELAKPVAELECGSGLRPLPHAGEIKH